MATLPAEEDKISVGLLRYTNQKQNQSDGTEG
jgi:hypothetical protein